MEAVGSPIPPPAATRRLDAADGPLVWIDCEMTGLTTADRLLEVACIITDGDLTPLDQGVSYVIQTPKDVLDNMNAWCVRQHGESGLTAECQSDSAHPHASVRAALLAYVRDRVPTPNAACLAGNTVHADKVFLVKEMPELVQHLHYRIVDVSSIKELAKRWYGQDALYKHPQQPNAQPHRALFDINASIDELKWYRQTLFKPTTKPN
ncbi:hypothetical protein Golomagni_07920 [Golovinomyces magnicellulatus]|uniref:Oligoribonuclease n=1 Tax=Pseudozyma antarctica (strain T-34) TaxID=1151754 RepID=M9LQ37_PSEA3|nr:hypothetical protein Golomagni_07920 [Golovinomyces magnicellulatus]GAC74431.1 oligoribonuclease [Moesziomyces antarcticus T-34]